MGKLIIFEGLDGSGKGTQTKLTADHLRQRGAENFPHLRVELGKPFGQKLAQDIVQRSLMFQHGVEDGTGKGLIPALQLLAAEFGIQHKV